MTSIRWLAPHPGGRSWLWQKLLGMGVYNGGMLVDADGTRHSYTGTITPYTGAARLPFSSGVHY